VRFIAFSSGSDQSFYTRLIIESCGSFNTVAQAPPLLAFSSLGAEGSATFAPDALPQMTRARS
jgi:hypothetical protein